MKNADKPISPQIQSSTNNGHQLSEIWSDYDNQGLTKREYFAGVAMQGMIAGRWACPDNVPNDVDTIVKEAILHADELLKKLEEK